MKKIIIAAIIILSVVWFVRADDQIKTIKGISIISSIETKCIHGYLFSIVIAWDSNGIAVSHVQIFREGHLNMSPQPIKCNG